MAFFNPQQYFALEKSPTLDLKSSQILSNCRRSKVEPNNGGKLQWKSVGDSPHWHKLYQYQMWHRWQLHNGESTDTSEESIYFYQVMTEVYKMWIWILRRCAPLYPDVKAAVSLCNNEDWKWNTTPAYKKLPFSLSQSICLYKVIEFKLKWCLSAKDWDVCRRLRRKRPIRCVMWAAYQVPYLTALTDRKSGLCSWCRLMLHEKLFLRTERSLQLDTHTQI